ncbi:ABC transporter substrate-binding protein [Paenibacillus spongiae]|uniref:Sugar ABC transporter substrate-binding protein n=1 Tax=Paenibacillus spongiae TaxID=2909671 RepID=A0ABY5SKN0_9BACL|nr:sugar ABC transporter substrate-binding protein [Paenibacillus spongiae]UVI33237.1 sugar ABC transporter substrate-binding protein [Paenibacillus spongiae]
MNPKKWFHVAMVLMLMLSLALSACSSGKSADEGEKSTDKPDVKQEEPAASGEKTTIRFSTWYGPGDIDIWKEVIKRFEAENPNITVKFEPLDFGAYWQKLPTQLASKSAPDVIGMHVGIVYGYVEKDQLAPLDDYIKVGGNQDKLPESITAEGQWPKDSPQQYALPWRFTGGALFVNLTAFKDAGVEYPENGWTIEQFTEAAKKLTNTNRFGLLAPGGSMQAGLMGAFGTEPTTADKLHSNYNTPEMLAFKTWVHDLIWKEKVAPNPKDVDSKVDPFVAGKVVMSIGGAWNFPVYREIQNFEWDVAPMPTKDGKSKTYAGPDMMSVTKDSKNKEAAWKFVEFAVYNQKAQELLRTTGLPMLKEDFANSALIDEFAAQKPAHFKVFLDGAVNNGIGYAFTKKYFETGKLFGDSDVKIMQSPNSDIKKELESLHVLVNKEFEKQ